MRKEKAGGVEHRKEYLAVCPMVGSSGDGIIHQGFSCEFYLVKTNW